MQKRIDYLDLAKAIGIICMVWLHVGTSYAITDIIVHIFHMPIFFIISGYCFNTSAGMKKTISRKIRSLLIPYFFYGILLCIIWTVIYNAIGEPEAIVPVGDVAEALFNKNAELSPYECIQWFLTALFFASILFCIICTVCKGINNSEWIIMLICLGFGVIGYLMSNASFRLPLSIDCAFMGVFFMGTGYFLRIKNILENKYVIYSSPILIPVVYLTFIFNKECLWNMRILDFGNPALYMIGSVSFSMMILIISKLICEVLPGRVKSGILFIGRNTIWFLIFNQFYRQVLLLIFDPDEFKISNIVIIILIVLLMIPTSMICNRFLGWTVGKRKRNVGVVEL